jgi:hypothetical protein
MRSINMKPVRKRESCRRSLLWGRLATEILLTAILLPSTIAASSSVLISPTLSTSYHLRGGATRSSQKSKKKQVFRPLAQALLPLLEDSAADVVAVQDALQSLSKSQQSFKALDGLAHEAYQRTHSNTEEISLHVSGRALRTVARTQAVALALEACEVVEILRKDSSDYHESLAGRQVLHNATFTVRHGKTKQKQHKRTFRVLVLYEDAYHGGAGVEHGCQLFSEAPTRPSRGRLVLVLDGDGSDEDEEEDSSLLSSATLALLQEEPQLVALSSPTSTTQQHEAASVQPLLYRAASEVLRQVQEVMLPYNVSAVHVVGHSLAGGVASLVATLLEGHLPLYTTARKNDKRKQKKSEETITAEMTTTSPQSNHTTVATSGNLVGWGRGRTSAIVLGAPPSVSANVPTEGYVTSILYGDDWLPRMTTTSLQRLQSRLQTTLSHRNSVTRQVMRWGLTAQLATQGLTAHAHGRQGEELRLTAAGQAYLLRPRRYGGHVSIHEIGRKSGREALRAAVLWQLHDILLSPSYQKHHELESYIQGLDRVHLRGLEESTNGVEDDDVDDETA